MRDRSVQFDLDWSNRVFTQKVWPVIAEQWDWFRDAQLMEPEGAQQLLRLMDISANMDFLARLRSGKLIAIATRCQRGLYSTFTIRSRRFTRADTELSKVLQAIGNHEMVAGYMVHAYLHPRSDELIVVYGARLRDIYDHLDLAFTRTNGSDSNRFLCLEAEKLEKAGVDVRIAGM